MNRYEKKAQQDKTSNLLNDIEGTASDRKLPMKQRLGKGVGGAAIKLLSGIGGGFAGAAIGNWSFVGGLVFTTTGEVIGSPELTSFGVGMLASNVIPTDTSVNGTEDEKKSKFQKAKDRMKSYGKGMMQKVWLDKLVKKDAAKTETKSAETTSTTTTTTEQSTSGMGEVKYYTHPQSEPDPVDLAELERYERQIKESGENFAKDSGVTTQENFSGIGDDEDFRGTEEERIY